MKDLGENPVATMLYGIWDAIKWWLITALTCGGGLLCGAVIGAIFRHMGWILVPQLSGISCVAMIPGVVVTLAALCVPMAIDSRRLAIGWAITNFTVWMLIGAAGSLDAGKAHAY